MARPQRFHFLKYGVPQFRYVTEFAVSPDAVLEQGTRLSASHFVPGQFVDVQSTSIGKGFQGVMKRWGFKGGRASHGNSLSHRVMGSTGQCQVLVID
jgi:large subunit ribosomal protein L3